MAFDNNPQPKFYALKLFAEWLVISVAGISGWVSAPLVMIAAYVLNWLAKHGIYFINVTGKNIRTNMDRDTFKSVTTSAWDEVEKNPNLTKAEGNAIDDKVIAAFDKFAVYELRDDGV